MKEKVDRYLKKGASYKRLLAEYKKHNTLVIGFDFNSTVHDYYKVGESYEMVRRLLRDLKSINCKCICWTTYKDPEYVIKFCKENNIPYDGVNCEGVPLPWKSRKPFFNILLDDRAGLLQTYNDLTKLVKHITNNEGKN